MATKADLDWIVRNERRRRRWLKKQRKRKREKRAEVAETDVCRRCAWPAEAAVRPLGIKEKSPRFARRGPERWWQGAAAIERHRERHGITDPQRALGPEPQEGLPHAERRPVERAVEDARAELSHLARAHERWATARSEPGYDRGPRHDLGHGIERGLNHGPSLGMGRWKDPAPILSRLLFVVR
jgi:hypothetical protein